MSNTSAASPLRRPSSQAFHPTHYLRVFYKRRWIAIPGFLLVFLSGAIDSVRTVPIYQATTQLMIEKSARRATSINTVLEERDLLRRQGARGAPRNRTRPARGRTLRRRQEA